MDSHNNKQDKNDRNKNVNNFDLNIASLNARGLRCPVKRQSLFLWLERQKVDVICLQETYCTKDFVPKFDQLWKGKVVHSVSDSAHSKGVAILFKKHVDFQIDSVNKDNVGRRLLLNMTVNNEKFSILNLYAPSDNPENRISFFKRASTWAKQFVHNDNQTIIVGDFNCVLSSQDRTSGQTDRSTPHFHNFIKYFEVRDIWRSLYPDIPGFTFINPGNTSQKSRLDYILLSPVLANIVKNMEIKHAPVPDHKCIIVRISGLNRIRGPSYWKLNTSVLDDDNYRKGIEKVYRSTYAEYSNVLSKQTLCDFIKNRAKEFSIWYCSNKAKQIKDKAQDLEEKIDMIDSNICINPNDAENLKVERNILKCKLDDIYEAKARGAFIRSKVKWMEEGEKSTKFFLNMENKHQTYNKIDKLKLDNGEFVENDADILKETVRFYSTLLSTKNPDPREIEDYISSTDIPNKLSNEEKTKCEGLVTKKECFNVIQKMKPNKSPGIDGLPVEFYKTFWYLIGDLLVDSYNEAFEKGRLSDSQNRSILSLIFKKGDRFLLKNYRPISLSTTDYKIIAFVLANRLHKVLDKIISPDQTGYVKKRFIGCNIRLVEDIIEYTEKFNLDGVILFLDYEKAFDSLEWPFMIKCLQHFNFGPDFIRWIEILYAAPEAMVKNNGWISESFKLSRGIRQGCPVSALLFIISMEIMASNVKRSNDIKGIELKFKNETKSVKIKQYADDSILFLKGLEEIDKALGIMEKFSRVSGLRLNISKTRRSWSW